MNQKDYLEYWHNNGKIPDRYYFQINGRTIQENYEEIRNKRQIEHSEIIGEQIETTIEEELEKAIGKMFKLRLS